jgi:hypothetical protein
MGDVCGIDPLDGSDLVRTARSCERTVRDRRAVSPSKIPSPLHSPTLPASRRFPSASCDRFWSQSPERLCSISRFTSTLANHQIPVVSRRRRRLRPVLMSPRCGRTVSLFDHQTVHLVSLRSKRLVGANTASTGSRSTVSSRLTIYRCLQGPAERPSKPAHAGPRWSSRCRPSTT